MCVYCTGACVCVSVCVGAHVHVCMHVCVLWCICVCARGCVKICSQCQFVKGVRDIGSGQMIVIIILSCVLIIN